MKKFDLVTFIRMPEKIAANVKSAVKDKFNEIIEKTENTKKSVLNAKENAKNKLANIDIKRSYGIAIAMVALCIGIVIATANEPAMAISSEANEIVEDGAKIDETTVSEITTEAVGDTVETTAISNTTSNVTSNTTTQKTTLNNEDTTIVISGSFVAKDDTLKFEEGFFENPDVPENTSTETTKITETTTKPNTVNETTTKVETTTPVIKEKTVINLCVENIEGDLVTCTIYITDNNGFYQEYQINGMKEISLEKGTYNVGIVEASGYNFEYSKAAVGEKGGYVIFTLLAK